MATSALIVEDDESVATTLEAILAADGFDVEHAATVGAALERVEKGRYDVALVDLRLEDGDGLTVLARLQEVAPSTVVLILTGYGALETATRAMRGGAHAYLLKPCNVQELKDAIAEGLDRWQRLETEAVRRRHEFLSRAGALVVGSLDYDTTLANVAQAVVPRLAEWCAVYVVGEDGAVRRLAGAHADPSKEALMAELAARYPLSADPSHPVRRALRAGRTVVSTVAATGSVDRYATDPEHARILRELGATSAVVVPLVARGQRLGAISLGPAEAVDPTLAEELAQRAALAIDNARLYREAQQAISTRDEFLATASHDLKTPLTSISGQAQLLARRAARVAPPECETLAAGLGKIGESTARMAAMINELLDVAHLRAGRPLDLERRATDLVDLARRIAAEAQGTTSRHTVRVAAAAPEIVGEWDAFRIERVVGNLLSNAVKYSPEGGEVFVTLTVEQAAGERWAVLTVEDHGVGIPAADLARVFERFVRAGNVVGRIRGTGIGLAGARKIAEQHGGSLTAESVEGEGSTFRLRLPLPSAAEASARGAALAAAPPPPTDPRGTGAPG